MKIGTNDVSMAQIMSHPYLFYESVPSHPGPVILPPGENHTLLRHHDNILKPFGNKFNSN